MNREVDLAAAYEQVTGRRFVPRELSFAGWMREAVGDTEGEDRAALDRGDYASESEKRRASDDYENRRERAASIARNENPL